jgi:DNA invertase Pin-like site-specific DNA recombinase
MKYGYCRCSTNEAMQDINRQKRELEKLGIEESSMFFEYASGSKADRVQFDRLLKTVKQGDTIAATEVSRLTRSTKQLCEILEFAKQNRLKLIIGSFIADFTAEVEPMTEGMLKMMGVFAEMERNMISQRVKSGMENAAAKGAKIGRPRTSLDNLPSLFLRHYPKYSRNEITVAEYARLCQVTAKSIYKYLGLYQNGR